MIVRLICFPTSYGMIYVCFHSWFCRICFDQAMAFRWILILNARGRAGGGPAALCCSTRPLHDLLAAMTSMVEYSKYCMVYSIAKSNNLWSWLHSHKPLYMRSHYYPMSCSQYSLSIQDQEALAQSARYFHFALPTHPVAVSLWLFILWCCCYLICTSLYIQCSIQLESFYSAR